MSRLYSLLRFGYEVARQVSRVESGNPDLGYTTLVSFKVNGDKDYIEIMMRRVESEKILQFWDISALSHCTTCQVGLRRQPVERLDLSLQCYPNESNYGEYEDTGGNSCDHCEYLYYASITLGPHLEINFPIEFIALTWQNFGI